MTSGSESAISPEGEGGGIKVDLGVPGGLEHSLLHYLPKPYNTAYRLAKTFSYPQLLISVTGKDQN